MPHFSPASIAIVPISPIAEIAGALVSVEVDLKWARSALIDLDIDGEPVPISAANLMRKAGERLLEASAQLSELAGMEGRSADAGRAALQAAKAPAP